MSPGEQRLYRLSPNQLKALHLLAKSESGVISSTASAKNVGKEGKALGGVFSSLARQKINGEHIVLPWGKSSSGHGLRWKLNEKIISKQALLRITDQLLSV